MKKYKNLRNKLSGKVLTHHNLFSTQIIIAISFAGMLVACNAHSLWSEIKYILSKFLFNIKPNSILPINSIDTTEVIDNLNTAINVNNPTIIIRLQGQRPELDGPDALNKLNEPHALNEHKLSELDIDFSYNSDMDDSISSNRQINYNTDKSIKLNEINSRVVTQDGSSSDSSADQNLDSSSDQGLGLNAELGSATNPNSYLNLGQSLGSNSNLNLHLSSDQRSSLPSSYFDNEDLERGGFELIELANGNDQEVLTQGHYQGHSQDGSSEYLSIDLSYNSYNDIDNSNSHNSRNNNDESSVDVSIDTSISSTNCYFIKNIQYANPLLNHPKISDIFSQAQRLGGTKAIDKIFECGANADSYHQFKTNINTDGLKIAVEKLLNYNDDFNTLHSVPNDKQLVVTSPIAPNSADDTQFIYSNNLVNSLFGIRQFIEYLPMIKYIGQNVAYPLLGATYQNRYINITMPSILDNKPLLFTAHLIAGHIRAVLIPQDDILNSITASSAGSLSFGARLAASHYLNEQAKQALAQDKPMDAFEVTKYCAATMLAYTVPSIVTCAIANFVMPGYQCGELALSTKISLAGAECYSVYKTSTKVAAVPTTADIVVPYVADGLVLVVACACSGNVMSVVSSVVTTDYMSRLAIDLIPDGIKEAYVHPVLDYAYNVGSCFVGEANAIINYFAIEHSTQEF